MTATRTPALVRSLGWENLKFAFTSLVTQKLRSFLTLLGIVAGVATVIAMVSAAALSVAPLMNSRTPGGGGRTESRRHPLGTPVRRITQRHHSVKQEYPADEGTRRTGRVWLRVARGDCGARRVGRHSHRHYFSGQP